MLEPARGGDLLARVEHDPLAALQVQVAEEGVIPAAEREVGQRRGHSHVDADHAGLDAVPELARCLAALRVDAGAVAEDGLVGRLDGRVQVIEAHDVQHRAKDLLLRDGHAGPHVVHDAGPEVEALRLLRHLHRAPVHRQLRALLHAALQQRRHLVTVLRADHRAHLGRGIAIGRAHRDAAGGRGQRRQQLVGGAADGDRGRAGHAALARAPEGRIHQAGDRVAEVGIGQHEHVVLGPAGRLHALAVLGAGLEDVLGHRRGTDERDGANLGVRQQRVHAFLPAVHHVQHTLGQAGLVQQLDQALAGQRHLLARLQNERVPAGQGQRIHPHRDEGGEVVGTDADADAHRLLDHVAIDAARDVLQDLALQQLGRAARVLHHLHAAPHVAARLGERLAVLARDAGRQLLKVILQQHLVAEQDAGAVHRRRLRPVQRRGRAGLHSLVHDVGPAHRRLGDHLAGGGVADLGGGGGRGDKPLAVDEDRDGLGIAHVLLVSCFKFPVSSFRVAVRHAAESAPFRPGRPAPGIPASSSASSSSSHPPW